MVPKSDSMPYPDEWFCDYNRLRLELLYKISVNAIYKVPALEYL